MGAAGRDFHDYNVVYRDDPAVQVVAFTAAQISGIAGRTYPPQLAGPLYPLGIPIFSEEQLEALCRQYSVQQVVFAYSDLTHEEVMHRASRALAAGADFVLLGPDSTMLQARLPVIAVCAVRTGCGKSQAARWISRWLRERGLRVAIVRHPMPYGDLAREAVQRFASRADLDAADCTIEEREEYEPHLALGNTVYAGADYARVLALAEAENDIILWDGGNNDFAFFRPDLHLVLTDALRPGQENRYHPGEAVLRMADVVIVAKTDVAAAADVQRCRDYVRALNPTAQLLLAASPVTLDPAMSLQGRKVIVVEDGPSITHGGMPHGAGLVAALQAGAVIVDPRPWAAPAIADVYARYPHIGPVLPAMGYTHAQLADLAATLAHADVEFVLSATPIDLAALLQVDKPVIRVRYEYADAGEPTLGDVLQRFLAARAA